MPDFPVRPIRNEAEYDRAAMKPIDLGKLVGGRAQASLILSGKRELSKATIRALADRFKVSPALFL